MPLSLWLTVTAAVGAFAATVSTSLNGDIRDPHGMEHFVTVRPPYARYPSPPS